MAPAVAAYYSYLLGGKHLGERRFRCPVLDVEVILSFMYADKEIKAPQGGIKPVEAGSCTSIKADKCFVQLTGSQIVTLHDRRAGKEGSRGHGLGAVVGEGLGKAGATRTRARPHQGADERPRPANLHWHPQSLIGTRDVSSILWKVL